MVQCPVKGCNCSTFLAGFDPNICTICNHPHKMRGPVQPQYMTTVQTAPPTRPQSMVIPSYNNTPQSNPNTGPIVQQPLNSRRAPVRQDSQGSNPPPQNPLNRRFSTTIEPAKTAYSSPQITTPPTRPQTNPEIPPPRPSVPAPREIPDLPNVPVPRSTPINPPSTNTISNTNPIPNVPNPPMQRTLSGTGIKPPVDGSQSITKGIASKLTGLFGGPKKEQPIVISGPTDFKRTAGAQLTNDGEVQEVHPEIIKLLNTLDLALKKQGKRGLTKREADAIIKGGVFQIASDGKLQISQQGRTLLAAIANPTANPPSELDQPKTQPPRKPTPASSGSSNEITSERSSPTPAPSKESVAKLAAQLSNKQPSPQNAPKAAPRGSPSGRGTARPRPATPGTPTMEMKRLQAEVKTLRQVLENETAARKSVELQLTSEKASFDQRNESLSLRLEELSSQLKDQEAIIQQYELRVQTQTQTIQNYSAKHQEFSALHQRYEEQAQRRESEMKVLLEELHKERSARIQLEQNNSTLNSQFGVLKDELSRAELDRDAISNELSQTRSRNELQIQKISQFTESQLQQLKTRIQQEELSNAAAQQK